MRAECHNSLLLLLSTIHPPLPAVTAAIKLVNHPVNHPVNQLACCPHVIVGVLQLAC